MRTTIIGFRVLEQALLVVVGVCLVDGLLGSMVLRSSGLILHLWGYPVTLTILGLAPWLAVAIAVLMGLRLTLRRWRWPSAGGLNVRPDASLVISIAVVGLGLTLSEAFAPSVFGARNDRLLLAFVAVVPLARWCYDHGPHGGRWTWADTARVLRGAAGAASLVVVGVAYLMFYRALEDKLLVDHRALSAWRSSLPGSPSVHRGIFVGGLVVVALAAFLGGERTRKLVRQIVRSRWRRTVFYALTVMFAVGLLAAVRRETLPTIIITCLGGWWLVRTYRARRTQGGAVASSDASTDAPPARLTLGRELGLGSLMGLVPAIVIVTAYAVLPDFTLVEDDSVTAYQPFVTESADRLLAGSLPLWSDWTDCGLTLVGRGQGLGLYPGLLLPEFAARGFGRHSVGVALGHGLHIVLGTVFTWLYLRDQRCGLTAAAIGTFGFAFSGPMYGFWTNWSAYAHLMAYVPISLFVVERLRDRGFSLSWTLVWALVSAQMFLLCDPLLLVKYLILLAAYTLLRVPASQIGAFASMVFLGGGLGAFCGSAQCLLTYQYVAMTERVAGSNTFDQLTSLSLGLRHYYGLLDPTARNEWHTGFMLPGHLWGATLFFGPLLAVALAGVFLTPLRRLELPWTLLFLCAAYAVLALGSSHSINMNLTEVPLIRHIRWPVRWTIELCSLGPLLIGVGVQQVLNQFDRRGMLIGVAAAVALVALLLVWQPRTPAPGEWGTGVWLIRLAYFVPLPGLVVLQAIRLRRSWQVAAVGYTLVSLVLAIPLAQTARFTENLRRWRDRPIRIDVGPFERVLSLVEGKDRQNITHSGTYLMSLPHQYQVRTVLGYTFPLTTQTWRVGVQWQGEVTDQDLILKTYLEPEDPDLLRLLRVGAILVHRNNEPLAAHMDGHPGFVRTHGTDELVVFRATSPPPPAWFATTLVRQPGAVPLKELIAAPLATTAFVDDAYTGPLDRTPGGAIHDYREHHGRIEIEVEPTTPCYLVIGHTYYPDWHAVADGREVPVYRTNSAFLGIDLPAGVRHVTLQYWPGRPMTLMAINWTVLAGIVFLLIGDGVLRIAFGRSGLDDLFVARRRAGPPRPSSTG